MTLTAAGLILLMYSPLSTSARCFTRFQDAFELLLFWRLCSVPLIVGLRDPFVQASPRWFPKSKRCRCLYPCRPKTSVGLSARRSFPIVGSSLSPAEPGTASIPRARLRQTRREDLINHRRGEHVPSPWSRVVEEQEGYRIG